MSRTMLFVILAIGAVTVVGLRGLAMYRRRAHDHTSDLTVSDAWLAEQRGRHEER